MSDSSYSHLSPTIHQSPPVNLSIPYQLSWLSGKHILITGGASGFGRSFAEKWARAGASVVIADINKNGGLQAVAEIRHAAKNPNVHFVQCDVRDWDSQVEMFKEAVRFSPHGGIDVVVANAGVSGGNGFNEPSGLDKDRPAKPNFQTVDVNLYGVLYTTHLALFWLPKNPGSHDPRVDDVPGGGKRDRMLLLLGSVASLGPIAGLPLYGAAKHAVLGLFRSLRSSAFVNGIRVNMLCPYFIDTPLLGMAGKLLLAGGAAGRVEDVVDAGSRLVADTRILGRALVIGPKVRMKEEGEKWVLLPKDSSEGTETAIWEAYADDWEEVDQFTKRMVSILSAIATARGWAGWVTDTVKAIMWRVGL